MNYTVRNLMIAATLMVVGIMLITSYIDGQKSKINAGAKEIEIYVAAKAIPTGTSKQELVDEGYLEVDLIRRSDLPSNSLVDVDVLGKNDATIQKIGQGEIVSTTAFAPEGVSQASAELKGTERLFSLPISSAHSTASMIRAGDSIDVFASAQINSTGGSKVMSWYAARDVQVIETPETLRSSVTSTDTTVESNAPAANGDPLLYVLKASDQQVIDILHALSASDKYGIQLIQRPSKNATSTKLTPQVGPVVGKQAPGLTSYANAPSPDLN